MKYSLGKKETKDTIGEGFFFHACIMSKKRKELVLQRLDSQ